MKTFKKAAAQGDVYFLRLEGKDILSPVQLAKYTKMAPSEKGHMTITHSETGHDHVMDKDTVTLYQLPDSLMECLLVVHKPTELKHLRDHDTHESIMFQPGMYKVRRQREHTPEGFRMVQD